MHADFIMYGGFGDVLADGGDGDADDYYCDIENLVSVSCPQKISPSRMVLLKYQNMFQLL
jgi:hypothetical protein